MGLLSWWRKKRETRVVVSIGQEGQVIDSRPYDPDEDDDKHWTPVGNTGVLARKASSGGSLSAPLPRKQRLSEFAFQEFAFSNPDSGTVYDDNLFQEITPGSFVDTPIEVHNRIVKLSLLQYKKNAKAFTIVEVVKDFVLGDDVTIDAADARVQELINEFWEENEWDEKLEERIRALAVTGEQIYPVFFGKDGILRISSVLPLQVLGVYRNQDNAEDLQKVRACVRSLSIDYRSEAVPIENDADDFTILKTGDARRVAAGGMQATEGKPDKCFFFAVNRIAGGTRGQPDLTPVMDWIEGVDSFMFTVLERAELALQVVFDLKCEGVSDPKQIQTFVTDFVKNLRAGEVYGHNEKVTLDVHSPTINSTEAEEVYNILSRMICSGVGLPGMFMGDADDLARASAAEMTIPPSKKLLARQRFVKRMLKRMIDMQIAWCKARTPARLEDVKDFSYQIRMPKIMLRDLSVVTRSIKGLADALASAMDREQPFITPQLAAKVFINALVDLDPTEDYLRAYTKVEDIPNDLTPQELMNLPPELYAAYTKVQQAKADMRAARASAKTEEPSEDEEPASDEE